MKYKRYVFFVVLFLLSIGKWMLDKQSSKAPKKEAQAKVVFQKVEETQEDEVTPETPEAVEAPEIPEPFINNDMPITHPTTGDKKEEAQEIVIESNQKRLLEACKGLVLFDEDKDILKEEELATNIHLKKDGSTFRLRVFTEDAENGSYKKLMYYKEDSEGFPQVIEIPSDKSTNPTEEYLESLLQGSEIIYESADLRFALKDGRTVSLTKENDEYIKFTSEKDNCTYEK
jgi:hypothetical protein